MKNTTPWGRAAGKVGHLWSVLDHVVFRAPDLDAVRRGWEVHGTGRGKRVYRDPRWHSIAVCVDCQGTGSAAAHPCPRCDGRGTVRHAEAGAGAGAGADQAALR